ncbi:MAG: phosphate signaling complex protein PhoU [Bacteroidetes bacterium]|nr:phosphate signaling complex protein PhoU [Bacteroidota bacterium]
MTHLNTELKILKSDIIDEWELVISQLARARDAVENFNKDIIAEMASTEKLIDAFELKIDMDCENLLALFNPLANDLRFVLAVLKINYNLERIGDFAWGLAKIVKESTQPFEKEHLEKTNLPDIIDAGIDMLKEALTAFENEDNRLARNVFTRDHLLDNSNKNAVGNIASIIKQNPEGIINHLNLLIAIRKIERVGDHTKNISEEIIFYLEAKVLRHKKHKNKV